MSAASPILRSLPSPRAIVQLADSYLHAALQRGVSTVEPPVFAGEVLQLDWTDLCRAEREQVIGSLLDAVEEYFACEGCAGRAPMCWDCPDCRHAAPHPIEVFQDASLLEDDGLPVAAE